MVAGAIRTDFILSAEIMVIALNEVADESFVPRAIILAVVAVGITVLVYGVVAAIVKMDDVGLLLTERKSRVAQRLGHGLVKAMPGLLAVISVVGIAAMLWVGGHILLVGTDDLGWHGLYDLVHHLEKVHHAVDGIGGVLAWLVNTAASADRSGSSSAPWWSPSCTCCRSVATKETRRRPRPEQPEPVTFLVQTGWPCGCVEDSAFGLNAF